MAWHIYENVNRHLWYTAYTSLHLITLTKHVFTVSTVIWTFLSFLIGKSVVNFLGFLYNRVSPLYSVTTLYKAQHKGVIDTLFICQPIRSYYPNRDLIGYKYFMFIFIWNVQNRIFKMRGICMPQIYKKRKLLHIIPAYI